MHQHLEVVVQHQVLLALVLVALITVANLRGLKESGRLFAGPVYGYVVAMSALAFLVPLISAEF